MNFFSVSKPWFTQRPHVLSALGFWLAAFVIFGVYYGILKQNQPTLLTDTYEYAQVARNIAAGKGIVTQTASVLEVALLGARMPLPYFYHDAGASLLMAILFKLVRASDTMIGWTSGIFYSLLAPLTFLLARKLFSQRTALLSAALVLLNPQLLVYATTGYSEVPYAFFLTLVLYLLWHTPSRLYALLAGGACGAMILLRSNTLPFVFWFALFIALNPKDSSAENQNSLPRAWRKNFSRQNFVALLWFGAGVAVFFVPALVRNLNGMHHPFYNVNSIYALVWYTSAIETKSSMIFNTPGLAIDPARFMLEHPYELLNKAQYQWNRLVPNLLLGGVSFNYNWADPLLYFLFGVSVLAPAKENSARATRLRWLVYALLLTAVLAGLAYNLRWRHLYGFLPIVSIYAAQVLARLFDSRVVNLSVTRTRLALASLIVIFGLAGLAPIRTNIHPSATLQIQDTFSQIAALVNEHTPVDAFVFVQPQPESNSAVYQNALTWYTDRTVVRYAPFTRRAFRSKNVERPVYLVIISENTAQSQSVKPPTDARFIPIAQLAGKNENVWAMLLKME